MVTGTLQQLRRETERLKANIATSTNRLTISLVGVHADGSKDEPRDVEGAICKPGTVQFEIVADVLQVLTSGKRHNLLEGGRGSGKSHGLARYFLALGVADPARFLQLREYQSSLRESVYYLYRSLIERDDDLLRFFEIGAHEIAGVNGSQYVFKGSQSYNADTVKSFEAFKYCWLEEAQSFTRRSLDLIVPTIRADGSRLFYNLNPTDESDAVYQDYSLAAATDPDIARCHVTIEDNYFAPQTLRVEADRLRERNPQAYEHVYGGQIRSVGESRVFQNWRVAPFDLESIIKQAKHVTRKGIGHMGTIRERERRAAARIRRIENSFYLGLDWGYTAPMAIVKVWIDETGRTLYIISDFKRSGVEIQQIPAIVKGFDPMVSEGWPITCDNARPELIQYLRRAGINAVACKKSPIVDRIDDLQQWSIVIDPECEETVRELSLYSWEEDRNGNFLPRPKDEHNHLIDGIFYAIGDAIKLAGVFEYNRLKDPFS